MSLASSSQRGLTLTEELEKLEQSITLTLQEIDHNFSRAHQVVTTSILPVVEQYGKHSKELWEGSKFWKGFFEASANVTISCYQEASADEESILNEQRTTNIHPSLESPPHRQTTLPYSPSSAYDTSTVDSSAFSSPTTSTPRAHPTIAQYSSPYENLRREFHGSPSPSTPTATSPSPSTPRGQTAPTTPTATGAISSPVFPPSTARIHQRIPQDDALLHRVLDQTFRVKATPHAQPTLPRPHAARKTPTTGRRFRQRFIAEEVESSPMLEAPALRADMFGSPERKLVPGRSVMTPAKKETIMEKVAGKAAWDSDSDDDDGWPEGMSPPKTIHFHIPQSGILKTPLREASRRIVDDLLYSAGGGPDDLEEYSPTIVKRTQLTEEDTF